MFLQEKEYTQLFRGEEKLMTAGLCKQIIWDQKIKVDYYMDHVPIAEGTKGQICLTYLIRQNGHQGLVTKQAKEPIEFSKSKLHYAMTKRELTDNQIVKIDDCYIEFEDAHTIRLQNKWRKPVYSEASVPEQKVNLTEKENTKDEKTCESIQETIIEDSNKRGGELLSAANYSKESQTECEETKQESKAEKKEEGKEERRRKKLQRIDNLKVLLEMGEDYVELYYNSFLLHSFYQYRHILIGEDFIGVPDYFYEREAIAAKMMGFPYFVEAKDVDRVCMEKSYSAKMPGEGTYGYFLRKL